MMKVVLWVGSTRNDLRAFPKEARRRAGHELYQVQRGLEPSDWKPMASVGAGVREIRIHTGLEHRVVYIAKFEEGVYALHAFEKKTRRTSRSDVELARRRLNEVLRKRRASITSRKEK
ncbi:MAG: type II toxin-antitoxin system RelE/ParE family toxin [bacterium]